MKVGYNRSELKSQAVSITESIIPVGVVSRIFSNDNAFISSQCPNAANVRFGHSVDRPINNFVHFSSHRAVPADAATATDVAWYVSVCRPLS